MTVFALLHTVQSHTTVFRVYENPFDAAEALHAITRDPKETGWALAEVPYLPPDTRPFTPSVIPFPASVSGPFGAVN